MRERGLDPEVGRLLRSLHNRAVLAAADGAVPPGEAMAAITDATALVDGVDEWLTQSEIVTIARDFVRPQQRRRRR